MRHMAKRSAKTTTVNLRISAAERQLVEKAARRAHLPVGTWMRQTCLRAAEQEAGGEERRARLLEFIQRAREGKVPPATRHAAEAGIARGEEWER
jgi:uncharacterized protein (DUF1778 family)